jgi:hypothetical protein
MEFQVVFHGIKVNQEELIFDGSEAPVRIDAETLLISEELAPVAILNKVIFQSLNTFSFCAFPLCCLLGIPMSLTCSIYVYFYTKHADQGSISTNRF